MVNARVIIEGLRSGIPYRETGEAMTIGRQENLKSLESLMDIVAQGKRPPLWGQVIRAQYGEGKTHLMHALASMAWDSDWVVSMVSVSKESPLDRLEQLYPKLVMNALCPGSNQSGLDEIVLEAIQGPHLLAESRDVTLSPRTRAILDNLARRNAGTEALLADLHGQFMSLADLKRIHRENFPKPLKIATTRIHDEILSYLILIDWLVVRAGYRGWLLLMDEVELMGKFGRGSRARSYVNIGRFLQGIGERTLSVWAVAGNFQNDVIIQRDDLERAPQWLESRKLEAASAPLARLALEELSAARPLSRPSTTQIRELVTRVYELHQAAYNWDPPVPSDRFYEVVGQNVGTMDARLRIWIRLAISILDLWLQHGVEALVVHAGALKDVDLSEEVDRDTDEAELIARRPLFE